MPDSYHFEPFHDCFAKSYYARHHYQRAMFPGLNLNLIVLNEKPVSYSSAMKICPSEALHLKSNETAFSSIFKHLSLFGLRLNFPSFI